MQKQQLRARFWVELVIAAVNIVLFSVTILWPEWIELVFAWSQMLARGRWNGQLPGQRLSFPSSASS